MRTKNYRVELPLAPEPMPTRPLILPWSAMISDNERFSVVDGQNRLSTPYRKAKARIADLAALHWRRSLLVGDVYLLARFWFPDLRKRDAGNYRKALTDALSKVIYADDRQVIDEHYVRMDIDRVNPRCEVWISDQPISLERAA